MAELIYRGDGDNLSASGGNCVAVPTVAGGTVYVYAQDGQIVASDSPAPASKPAPAPAPPPSPAAEEDDA